MESLTEYHNKIDALERAALKQAPEAIVDVPLVHHFTNGLYMRQMNLAAGTLITSKVHKTEHPFTIMQGRVSVFIPGEGAQHLEAPYMGVTRPGTRRVIYAHEDTIWVTFHPNTDNEQDLDQLEERIIERRELEDGKTGYELARELYHALQLEDTHDLD